MKKQTAMFLSVSAVLALGVLAPKVWWNDTTYNRAPASEEAEAPLKPLEKVELKSQPVAHVDVEAEVSCLKDKQPADLKAEIQKLMKDKEEVLKELADLKKDDKKDDKKEDKKKIVKAENTDDLMSWMMQMTSMMMSQQQQQMTMMNNMFSMLQIQQQPQSKYQGFSPMSEYMSPYAFNASDFVYPKTSYDMQYPMSMMGNHIGLSSDYGRAYSPYTMYDRQPAQQLDARIEGFDRALISQEAQNSFQPQQLEKRPHNGFDFR